MPKYSKTFMEPDFYEHTIYEAEDGVATSKAGTLRIKPVSILWKPKGAQQFYRVTLDKFDELMREYGKRVDQ